MSKYTSPSGGGEKNVGFVRGNAFSIGLIPLTPAMQNRGWWLPSLSKKKKEKIRPPELPARLTIRLRWIFRLEKGYTLHSTYPPKWPHHPFFLLLFVSHSFHFGESFALLFWHVLHLSFFLPLCITLSRFLLLSLKADTCRDPS